jgi:hypothetical protein
MQDWEVHVKRIATVVAVVVVGAGCGGNLGQADARDQATKASCDWYDKCGEIGSGKRFATRDDCEVDVRAGWNSAWPYQECNDRIPRDKLDVCISAIKITTCGNGFDIWNTLVVKCGKAEVCSG